MLCHKMCRLFVSPSSGLPETVCPVQKKEEQHGTVISETWFSFSCRKQSGGRYNCAGCWHSGFLDLFYEMQLKVSITTAQDKLGLKLRSLWLRCSDFSFLHVNHPSLDAVRWWDAGGRALEENEGISMKLFIALPSSQDFRWLYVRLTSQAIHLGILSTPLTKKQSALFEWVWMASCFGGHPSVRSGCLLGKAEQVLGWLIV